jgi:hypothetical protein
MATWKDVSGTDIGFYAKGDEQVYTYYANKGVRCCLQYDADITSATRLYLRFKLYTKDGNGCGDKFNILMYPGTDKAVLYKIKTNDDSTWTVYSSSFSVTKTYTAKNFTLPNYWICDLGSSRSYSTAQAQYDAYKTAWYQSCMTTAVASKTVAGTVAGTAGEGTDLKINNKKNNTVEVYGKLGTVGTNNSFLLSKSYLYYTTNGSDPNNSGSARTALSLSGKKAGDSFSYTVNITSDCTVKAYLHCEYTYNSANKAATAEGVKYYKKPSAPGLPIPMNTPDSSGNIKLTVNKPWEYYWTPATKGNNNSSIQGYELTLYRCAKGSSTWTAITGLTAENGTDNIVYNASNTKNYLRRQTTSTNANIKNPKDFGFVAGDKARLSVKAYSKDGAENILLGPANEREDGDEWLIQNAGVVQFRSADGTWKEGQVFVYVNGVWKEAETVSIRTVAGTWKESQ